MPVPATINDLSTTAASNSPAGSEPALPQMDDFIRALSAFIAQLRDGKLDASSVSTFMQSVLDDADAATARATLGAVGLTGDQTIAGVKTFSSSPVVPTATTSGQAVNKGQIESAIAAIPSASTSTAGKVQLATTAETQAGSNSSKAVVPSAFKAASAGYGGTTDVTSSRAFGTPYTNNTGRPLMVNVCGSVGGGSAAPKLIIDGTITVWGSTAYSGGSFGSVSWLVPPGSTYQAGSSSSMSLVSWTEG